MYLVLVILIIIVCAFLGMIVMIQNPKGGGLTSNFSSQSQLMGVQKTGDFLEKGTWILAIGLMVLSLLINVTVKSGVSSGTTDSQYQEQINKSLKAPASAPATAPLQLPATTPAQQAPAPKK